MAHLVSFRSARFDVRAEDPNPINPIPGQGVLRWLRAELARANCTVTEPSTEDWGWYVDVEAEGAHYLVGASADVEGSTSDLEGSTPDIEWMLQVHKHRSLKERILGLNKMAADDPLVARIEGLVRGDPRISDVSSVPGGG
jgi:hypothetical protein